MQHGGVVTFNRNTVRVMRGQRTVLLGRRSGGVFPLEVEFERVSPAMLAATVRGNRDGGVCTVSGASGRADAGGGAAGSEVASGNNNGSNDERTVNNVAQASSSATQTVVDPSLISLEKAATPHLPEQRAAW